MDTICQCSYLATSGDNSLYYQLELVMTAVKRSKLKSDILIITLHLLRKASHTQWHREECAHYFFKLTYIFILRSK